MRASIDARYYVNNDVALLTQSAAERMKQESPVRRTNVSKRVPFRLIETSSSRIMLKKTNFETLYQSTSLQGAHWQRNIKAKSGMRQATTEEYSGELPGKRQRDSCRAGHKLTAEISFQSHPTSCLQKCKHQVHCTMVRLPTWGKYGPRT